MDLSFEAIARREQHALDVRRQLQDSVERAPDDHHGPLARADSRAGALRGGAHPRFFFDSRDALLVAYRDIAKRIDPALPLSLLEARVKAWVERQKATASGPVR